MLLSRSPSKYLCSANHSQECQLVCKSSGRRAYRDSNKYPFKSDETCSPQSRQAILEKMKRVDRKCNYNAHFDYTLHVQHWSTASSYSFASNGAFFDFVKSGDMLKIPVNQGAFRLEWVNNEQVVMSRD